MTRLSEMPTAELMALITRRHISPAAARAFRERRGATHEEMADVLGVSPGEVAAWEAGTMRVPSAQAYQMRSMAEAWTGRIPHGARPPWCPWVNANVPGLYDGIWRFTGELRFTDPVQRHVDACAECQRVIELRDAARANPAQERGLTVPPEEVGPGTNQKESLRFLCMAVAFPAAVIAGAVFVSEVSGVGGDVWPAGSTGFLAFEIARRFVRTRMSRRPYAAGLVMGVSGMLAAMLSWKLLDRQDNVFDPVGVAGCGLVALLVGLLTGWMRDGYEVDDAEADDGPEANLDGQHADADGAPRDPETLLAAPNPLAAPDEVRAGPRPEHATHRAVDKP